VQAPCQADRLGRFAEAADGEGKKACMFYGKMGSCLSGDACEYAHIEVAGARGELERYNKPAAPNNTCLGCTKPARVHDNKAMAVVASRCGRVQSDRRVRGGNTDTTNRGTVVQPGGGILIRQTEVQWHVQPAGVDTDTTDRDTARWWY
jgi:hypothetical protein